MAGIPEHRAAPPVHDQILTIALCRSRMTSIPGRYAVPLADDQDF